MKNQKLNIIKTLIIGLGFFTVGLSWALYNSYMPIFLRDYIDDSVIIGIIMALDNILAIFLLPIIGAFSDRIRTKIGRRMPFILVGIPIAALFFTLIPFDKLIASSFGFSLQGDMTGAFIIRMFLVSGFIVGMTIYRSPVIALMPDVTPDKHRSTANGIINLMGGIGAVFAFAVGSWLYSIDRTLPFIITSILMILSMLLLLIFVKEPKEIKTDNDDGNEEKIKIIPAMIKVFKDKDKSGLLILLSILFWFMAYNALEAWFTTYATNTLVLTEKVEPLKHTENWELHHDGKMWFYKSNTEMVGINYGDTVIFLKENIDDSLLNKETVILKKDKTILLLDNGNIITLESGDKYTLPYNKDKSIILATNGNTLILDKNIEKDINEIQDKYTITSPTKCDINQPGFFCREVKENEASGAMTFFSLLFIITCIPAGIISKKIGRKNTIRIGLIGLILIMSVLIFIKNIDTLKYILAFGGIFWALININSIAMIWEIATDRLLGTYTGLYYFFSQAAAVSAPPIFGLYFNLIDYKALFPASVIFFLIAFILMSFVKSGEYVETSKSKLDVFDND